MVAWLTKLKSNPLSECIFSKDFKKLCMELLHNLDNNTTTNNNNIEYLGALKTICTTALTNTNIWKEDNRMSHMK